MRNALLRGISSRILINLRTLVMFRTAEWSVSRRTAPRYLPAGGGPATCHDLSCFPLGG